MSSKTIQQRKKYPLLQLIKEDKHIPIKCASHIFQQHCLTLFPNWIFHQKNHKYKPSRVIVFVFEKLFHPRQVLYHPVFQLFTHFGQ